ncbi:MAG: hypothetical protein BMS9Abin14_174 [Gammaproteobacteria bacterium]|nr:MAG: hypothetical protein BMS9Abin14_174 [Gammaproteobacteria bacterium]
MLPVTQGNSGVKFGTVPIFQRVLNAVCRLEKMGTVPNFTARSIRGGPLLIAFEDDQRLRIAGDDTVIDDDLGDVAE